MAKCNLCEASLSAKGRNNHPCLCTIFGLYVTNGSKEDYFTTKGKSLSVFSIYYLLPSSYVISFVLWWVHTLLLLRAYLTNLQKRLIYLEKCPFDSYGFWLCNLRNSSPAMTVKHKSQFPVNNHPPTLNFVSSHNIIITDVFHSNK